MPSGMLLLGAGRATVAAAPAPVWDASYNTGSGMTLGPGNIRATKAAGTVQTVRSTRPFVGKSYVGIQWSPANNFNILGGVTNTSLANTGVLGDGTTSVGIQGQGNVRWMGGNPYVLGGSLSQSGAENLLAVDLTLMKFWIYNPTSGWRGSNGGPDDPITGTGGWDLTTGPTGTIYPGATMINSGDWVEIVSSSFANSAQVTALNAAGWSVT